MRHYVTSLVVLLLAAACAPALADEDPALIRARELLQLLVDGKFDEFVAAGDDTMRKGFTATQAAQAWAGVAFQLGSYQREVSAKVTPVQGYSSVQFICRFARGTLTMRIIVDPQGRLSGLWFDKLLVDWTPPDYADSEKFREVDVTVSAGQFALPGTLAIPHGDDRPPAVVLLHGSGPNDRDGSVGGCKPLKDIVWGLASRGVAVLSYDKRTHVHPYACKPEDWTVDSEVVEDAVAAVELLRKRDDIDPARVFVAGHSMGGWAAPLVAKQDDKLAGIVLLAASARSVLDLIEEQTQYTLQLAGFTATKEQREEAERIRANLEQIRAGHAKEVTEPVLGVPAVYWAHLHETDTPAVAAKLSLPILVIQGGRDYQVRTADFDLWKSKLADHKNATFKSYAALNHLFVAGSGLSTPAEYAQPGHVDRQLIEDLAAWIREH